jgi:hypothetical protein
MADPVPSVDFATLTRMLEQPLYKATTWTSHCGCHHEAGSATIERCSEHAQLL